MGEDVLKNPCYVLWLNILFSQNPTNFSQKGKIWWFIQMCFNLISVSLLSLCLLDIPSSWERTRWVAPFHITIWELCLRACAGQLVCVGKGHTYLGAEGERGTICFYFFFFIYSVRMGPLKRVLKILLKLPLPRHGVYLICIPFNDKTNKQPQLDFSSSFKSYTAVSLDS